MKKPSTMDEVGPYFMHEVSEVLKMTGLAWNVTWGESQRCTHRAPRGRQTNWGDRKDKDGNPLPTGYPGWYGRVWVRFEEYPDFMRLSNILSSYGIHPGTGGEGAYNGIWSEVCHAAHILNMSHNEKPHCFSWDCTIFDEDWPGLVERDIYSSRRAEAKEQFDKELSWKILSGRGLQNTFHFPSLMHKYEWTDPAQIEKDRELIHSANVLQLIKA